ncbi:SAICAR synthase-like protein [Ramaria rubella]|nr:SAICAR synthase-like protein [Ramaria rubella]
MSAQPASELSNPLDPDILEQADQIRRERLSRRAKAQLEAEAALTRAQSKRTPAEEEKVLVGNLIGEDHVNYVLMYNMLTGIRIGVSRCQAKMNRPLTEDDFTAKHKFSFDIIGNELTPSAKYDFKFKDYAPWVFRELREEYFRLDPADYLLSLTAKYILSELGSPGKSGSFFYFSRDYRFIIKTIHHNEHKFLLSILKDYYHHVKTNPHTLLSRFYGLHRVKLPRGRKIHFVIMNNLFPPHRDIHETYDLKGSTVGRLYPEDKAAENPRAVLKDLNWIDRQKQLELGPEKRAFLTEQIRSDLEFLKKVNVMDYSLLVGVHNMQRGNRDNLRSNTLKVFSPDVPRMRRKSSQVNAKREEAFAIRKAMRESDPKALGAETTKLPDEEPIDDRQYFLFYQDEGGYRATSEFNTPQDTIYYLGIIDICTPYSTLKKLEHFWKGLKADRHKISPVEPVEYAQRFFNFLTAIMRGGEGGQRFKAE